MFCFALLLQTEHGVEIVKVTPDTRGLESIQHLDGKTELKVAAYPCPKCDLEFTAVSKKC